MRLTYFALSNRSLKLFKQSTPELILLRSILFPSPLSRVTLSLRPFLLKFSHKLKLMRWLKLKPSLKCKTFGVHQQQRLELLKQLGSILKLLLSIPDHRSAVLFLPKQDSEEVLLNNSNSSNKLVNLERRNLLRLQSCYRRSQSWKLFVNMESSVRNLNAVSLTRVQ